MNSMVSDQKEVVTVRFVTDKGLSEIFVVDSQLIYFFKNQLNLTVYVGL